MPDNPIPFFSQAALLDSYIKSENPSADRAALEVIVVAIREDVDLRRYFFRNRPHPAWASVLWDYGFLTEPPEPAIKEDEKGNLFRETQEYLFSVAEQSPEILVKHINSIGASPRYKANATYGAQFLPQEFIEQVLPTIIQWLADREVGEIIAYSAYELMVKLAKSRNPAALKIFDGLTRPLQSLRVQEVEGHLYSTEAVSVFPRFSVGKRSEKTLSLLNEIDPSQVVSILERQLKLALKIEAESKRAPEYEYRFQLGGVQRSKIQIKIYMTISKTLFLKAYEILWSYL